MYPFLCVPTGCPLFSPSSSALLIKYYWVAQLSQLYDLIGFTLQKVVLVSQEAAHVKEHQ